MKFVVSKFPELKINIKNDRSLPENSNFTETDGNSQE